MSELSPRRRVARIVARLLFVVAVVYGLYLLLANLFLSTALAEVVNRHPERQRVSWGRGWSWVPGSFRVADFRFERHGPRGDLEVELETLSGRIELASLLERRLRIDGLRGGGFSFDWRVTTAGAQTAASEAEPGSVPGGDPGPRGRAARKPLPLAIELENIVIDGLDHFAIQGLAQAIEGSEVRTGDGAREGESAPRGLGGIRLEGTGGVSGSLQVDRDRRLWIDGMLRFVDGQLFDGRRNQAAVAEFSGHVAINGWQPSTTRGVDALPHVSGSLELEASSADLALLAPLLGGQRGVEIAGRGDLLDIDLRLVAGRLTAGSHLLAGSRQTEVAFLDYRARGRGQVEGKVKDDGSGIELALTLDDYALQRSGLAEPHLRGTGFVVQATHGSTLLHTSTLRDSSVKVEWPAAELPDLTLYNAFLPAEHDVRILGGHGTVAASFTLDEKSGKGRAKLEAQGARLRFDALELAGRLTVDTRFADLDWQSGTLPVSGSRVELREVAVFDLSGKSRRVPRARDWWARVVVEEGTLGRDLSFRGTLDARLRDTGPLIALYQRHRLPGFVEDALRIDDVHARLHVTSSRKAVTLDDIAVEGQGLEILGRLHLAEKRAGLLYLRYRRLALAAEVEGEDFELQLLRPKQWFEKRFKTPTPSRP